MQKIDPVFLSVVSDLLINLSSGWFGVAVVVPLATDKPRKVSLKLLTANLVLAILALMVAFNFRKAAT